MAFPMTPQAKLRALENDWVAVDHYILAHPERYEPHELECARKRLKRLEGNLCQAGPQKTLPSIIGD